MNKPLIQLVDDDDNPIGTAPKQDVWDKGLLHRVVRVMVENDKGEILLQRRNETKPLYPGRWENSAAGHVDAGEEYLEAAKRELAEEVGIDNIPLEEMWSYRDYKTFNGIIMNSLEKVFRAKYNRTPTKLSKREVVEVKWMSPAEIKKLIAENPDNFTPGLRDAIEHCY